MQITLSNAIGQLRDDLREAMLEGRGKDIIFVPKEIELELGITFGTEIQAEGGLKLLAFLDLSAGAKSTENQAHKIRLKLEVGNDKGEPIKVRSNRIPGGV